MELILQQNTATEWRFEAAKRFAAPKNLGEFIARIPILIAQFYDHLLFEFNFQLTWFLRRLIFNQNY
jgi:hypothetical protein